MRQGFHDIEIERRRGKFGNPCSLGMLRRIGQTRVVAEAKINYNYHGKSKY